MSTFTSPGEGPLPRQDHQEAEHPADHTFRAINYIPKNSFDVRRHTLPSPGSDEHADHQRACDRDRQQPVIVIGIVVDDDAVAVIIILLL